MAKTTTSNQPQHRLTLAKRKTLELIAEYFCLKTNDLAALVRNRRPTEHDKRTTRRTLHLLWQQGLLNRLPYLDLNQASGGLSYVYGLSDKAFKDGICSTIGVIDGFAKTFDEHSQRTLDHELEISTFHRTLKKLPLELYWQQTDLTKTVHPDAYFALTDPTKPDGRNTLHYFLEIERAKPGNYVNGEPQIVRKLEKYYNYFDTAQCEEEWGFRKFRVVIVLRNETRAQHLLQRLAEKWPHRMFWLTTEPLYKSNISSTIFLTPRDYETQAYSF